MVIPELLKYPYTELEAKSLQEKYAYHLEVERKKGEYYVLEEEIKVIAGTDITYYPKNDEEWGIACVVLWDVRKNEYISHSFLEEKIAFPYISGFLGFRECPLLGRIILNLSETPDMIMCDGHGIIHPRRFGEAVHLGMAIQVPTCGIAKTPFIGHYEWKDLERVKGNKSPIYWEEPRDFRDEYKIIGYSACLADNKRPIFISEGYKMSLGIALHLALSTANEHKQPEPLYLADRYSRERREEIMD